MKKLFLLIFITFTSLILGCGISETKRSSLPTHIKSKTPEEIIKVLLTPFYAYGMAAYEYKKKHNNWPKDNLSLINETKELFPELNLDKVVLVSTNTAKNNQYEIKSILMPSEKPPIQFSLVVKEDENRKPSFKLNLDKKAIVESMAKEKESKKNKTSEFMFGLMLAVAFNKMFGGEAHIHIGSTNKSLTKESQEQRLKYKFKTLFSE